MLPPRLYLSSAPVKSAKPFSRRRELRAIKERLSLSKEGETKQIFWITGASSGIGEALASLLSTRGARLILSSNEPAQLEEVKERCTNRGAHWALPLDLSEPDKMKPKAKKTLERYGHVDILVNNGGISIRALASETTLEIDRRIIEIDYFGHIALTKAVLPSMLQRKEGHIVVTTSLMGIMPAPLRSAYWVAKHGLTAGFAA